MDQAQPVDSGQGDGQGEGAQRLRGADRTLLPQMDVEGPAVQQFHGQVGPSGVHPGVEHPGGVRAGDRGEHLHLAFETEQQLGVVEEFGVDGLQGHLGPRPLAPGEVHRAHAARADPAEQPVSGDGARLVGVQGPARDRT
nr:MULTISPECIES: hypothetical protein [unclassified Streptomyces]